jgi:hypothetical protein
MPGFRASAPAQDTGYYRTSDWQSTNGSGPQVSTPVNNSFLNSTVQPTGTWHPTVVWLIGFVVVELVAYHVLSSTIGV